MNKEHNYVINLDARYDYLEVVDLKKIVEEVEAEWFNQTLCQVNDSVVRLGVLKGEFHWHKHKNEDEFFFVIEGKLFVDIEKSTVELKPQQGYAVPKGVQHRTRAPERTVVLMISKSTVRPVGDDY